jgi:zinc protease
MNLREDKHWSYGARSFFVDALGQRPFIAYAPVQTDKTTESMHEIQKELSDIVGDRPPTTAERDRAVDKKTLTLPGRWETGGAVASSLAGMVRFGLPEDYWASYPDEMRAQTAETLTSTAQAVIHPGHLTWVVVGDRAKIEDGIRAGGFGAIHIVDADGNPVDGSPRTAEDKVGDR